MHRAVEDPFGEGLDRPAADVQIPQDVTGRARAHLRGTKIAARAVLAGGAAAVTAAAVVAGAVPGQGAGGRPVQVRTTAVVITRVAHALAAPDKVIQTEMIFSAAVPPVWVWNYRSHWRFTQSGYIPPSAADGRWARGWVNWGTGNQRVGGRWRWVQVDYGHHRWSTGLTFAPPPNACTVRLDIVEFMISQPKWPAYIRQGLSCGLFHLAGHGPVDGVQAIRLTGSQADRHFWSFPHGAGRGPLRVDVTLYVNPKTYLPMLVIWNNRTHHRDGRPWDGTVRDDITALPATPANIAKANVTFPASFHRVPGSNPFNILLFSYFTSN